MFDYILQSGLLITSIGWLREWFTGRHRSQLDKMEVYRTISESKDKTLLQQNERIIHLENELLRIREELSAFRRSVSKIMGCRYYRNCPMLDELSKFSYLEGVGIVVDREESRCRRADSVDPPSDLAGNHQDCQIRTPSVQ